MSLAPLLTCSHIHTSWHCHHSSVSSPCADGRPEHKPNSLLCPESAQHSETPCCRDAEIIPLAVWGFMPSFSAFQSSFFLQRVKSSRRMGCHVPALSQLEVLFKMLSRTTAVWACISCQRAHTPTPLVLAFLRVTTCQLWRRQVGGKCQVFVTFI